MDTHVWALREQVFRALAEGVLEREAVGLGLARREPARASRGPTAVIPLHGILTPRGSALLAAFGADPGGLASFRAEVQAAAADESVERIVLDVDSPGGMVDGVPETAALLREVGQRKPIIAVANTEAASAAYWLASQANELYAAPSAIVGSIGVYATHVSSARALDAAGLDVTVVSAGERKTELHPALELSDSGREQLQGLVDDAYRMFVADVARGRDVSEGMVAKRYGQGAVLPASAALEAGMIDGIATLYDAVAGRVSPSLPRITQAGDGRLAGPIPSHDTDVVDEPWDGAEQEAAIPNDAGRSALRRMYAWVDPEADPDTKAAYAFPHHMVRDGQPREANVRAVRNALARLPQSRVPRSDWPGVQRHLRRHLEAFRRQQGAEGLALVDELAWAACAVGATAAMARLRELTDEHRELIGAIEASLAELREVPETAEGEELRREVARAFRLIADL
jgi:signal peptide peptidase SppA